jgi:hypothetical protein
MGLHAVVIQPLLCALRLRTGRHRRFVLSNSLSDVGETHAND